MKICDVVLNSIHYDPRVNRQIEMYSKEDNIELTCVGLMDNQYSEEKIDRYPFKVEIVPRINKYNKKMKTPIGKIIREVKLNSRICDAIISCKPDVIHANDLDALIPSMVASAKTGCKVIYDSHEIYTENLWLSKKKIYKKILFIVEKKLVKNVDLMVCVSHAAAEYFAKIYKIKKPLVVTNCTHVRNYSIYNEPKHSGFEVLNHGQYYAGRGYDIMVEAIPFLKDYPEINLALRGFGKMETSLRKRAEELGDENFHFYPKVLVQDLIPMAAKSHVGVAITEPICLNFELSVSNKIFEYASAGLPVIMSDIPEHRYLNEKYQFGIIIPDNKPETFAQAAIKLYTDKNFYNECAQNARKLSNEINWENEFQKLINLECQWMEEKNK